MKLTPLMRKSNLSTIRFREYYTEMLQKGLVKETEDKKAEITNKGLDLINKYNIIRGFIEEFDL